MPLKNKKAVASKKNEPKSINKLKTVSKAIVKKKTPAEKANAKIIKTASKIAKHQSKKIIKAVTKETVENPKKIALTKKNQASSPPKKQPEKMKLIAQKTDNNITKKVSAKNKKTMVEKTAKLSSEKNVPQISKNKQPQSEQLSKIQIEPKAVRIESATTKPLMQPVQAKKRTRSALGPVGFSPYSSKLNESYMNDAQLKHFQHILNLWKQQLLAGRDIVAAQMRDDAINFPDPLDRAALEEEHTLEWRAREREHRLIMKIDQALAHIKQGEYGYCESCGAEIGIERLEARPTATQCIDCKTINELRERHTGILE